MGSRTLSRLIRGKVMHRRLAPFSNCFVYPVHYLLLNMDELEQLNSWVFGVNRPRPLSIWYKDYGNGTDPRMRIRALLQQEGIHDCSSGLWLQTFPRVFGFAFNPVSFWYCERDDGTVGAVIAEVNNTFGDRHCYLLYHGERIDEHQQLQTTKRLHVSPFYPVKGDYHFRLNCDLERPFVGIDYHHSGQLQLETAIWGESESLTSGSVVTALIRQPLLTLGVVWRIHWQALRLWIKGAKYHPHPSPSHEELTR